ncbi:sodium/proton antiporter NhaB [Marinicellulosiphila megalodicopiae]|uniref:sodium/proton antiporter NhaB n=1 Tax=Marinicellulosiphila megalodicopiae TaxID=2724896 RepID=UPI003BAE2B65
MKHSLSASFFHNFMGNTPKWYKLTIIGFLILNPIIFTINHTAAGWILVIEFIFTLAMALKCYPLIPGGLLAIESVAIGMTGSWSNESGHGFEATLSVMHEIENNLPVLLLLMFMVAGIYFMKDLLLYTFTKLLLKIRNKILLALTFSFSAAILSAFLDALTVTAVLISVAVGFYSIYHKVASGKHFNHSHDHSDDQHLQEIHRADLDQFRSFLRSLIMHGAIGTALGGSMTLVGEPQNLLIASKAHWDFIEFALRMAPVTVPVLFAGLLTCIALEVFKKFGYGDTIPKSVYQILLDDQTLKEKKQTTHQKANLIIQALVAVFLVVALATHLAEVGVIGLAVIILLTAFTGAIDEHQIGKSFEEALPFTALLVVFFTIVAVIDHQHLFTPMITWVLTLPEASQPGMFFIANGVLSAISDNVFVATVYIGEIDRALQAGSISKEQFELLAVAINTGTNLPSVATPNGQAAFLFLLTSAAAPLLRLSYGKMVWMALPYTVVMGTLGYICVTFLL